MGSMMLIPPLVAGLLLSGPALGILFAILAGAATIATFSVTIVMGQEFLPARLGLAAGITIGLSIGLGGVGAPLLGLLADAHGLRSVLEVVAVLPIVALALTLALPRDEVGARVGRGTRVGRRAAHVTDPREPF
jgi:FSR family fosmidomycin resistance protein-like MFS transporter